MRGRAAASREPSLPLLPHRESVREERRREGREEGRRKGISDGRMGAPTGHMQLCNRKGLQRDDMIQ